MSRLQLSALLCLACLAALGACTIMEYRSPSGTVRISSLFQDAPNFQVTPTDTQPGMTVTHPARPIPDQAMAGLWALPLMGVGLMTIGVLALALKAKFLVIPYELGGYLIALGLVVTMLPVMLDRYSWVLALGIVVAVIHVWWRWNKNRSILSSMSTPSPLPSSSVAP